MSDTPFIPFYTSDFLAGTGGLTASTKGVYITLICLMYESEAPLKQSFDVLARRCGSTIPAFKKAVEALVDDGKMSVTADGIWSHTCDKHLALRCERSNSARSAAKTRWQKNQQKQCEPDATASVAQCQPEPEPEPYTSTDVEVATAPTEREQILKAIGADPASGMIGPNGTMIGRTTDMAEQAKWAALGISLDDQCAIIRERVQSAARGGKVLAPKSFSYFSGAMSDFAAAKSKPMPVGVASHSKATATDAKLARWNRIAGQA